MVENLPVKRIVLFKNGVAYFERSGPAEGVFELEFGKDDINDVLKSLVVWVESDDAKLGAIGFDRPEDPDTQLADRQLKFVPGKALSGMLGAFQGQAVVIGMGQDQKQGEIIGLQTSPVGHGAEQTQLILRTESASIEIIDLSTISRFQFIQPSAISDLALLVDQSRSATANRKRSLWIDVKGKASDLRISYILPAPVWQVTYRVAFSAGRVTLMGWAVVHNPVDENLQDIALTLTSGRPNSFLLDLYNPQNIQRTPAKNTQVPGSGFKPSPEELMYSLCNESVSYSACISDGSPSPFDLAQAGKAMVDATESSERGELFDYHVSSGISFRRGGSAMVPLFSRTLPAEVQTIWRSGASSNPDVFLLFKNDTELTLEQGAAVVYRDSLYAGEAMLPFIAKGAEVRLPFAKDLAVNCNIERTTHSEESGIVLDSTFIVTELRFEEKYTLVAENKHDEEITVLFELPAHELRHLDPAYLQPVSSTFSTHTFAVVVRPHDKSTSTVVSRWRDQRFLAYSKVTGGDINLWLRKGFLDDEMLETLRPLIESKERIATLSKELSQLSIDKAGIAKSTKTVVDQLAVLKEVGEEGNLRKRFVEELEKWHDKIDRLDAEMEKIKQEISLAEQQRDDILKSFSALR